MILFINLNRHNLNRHTKWLSKSISYFEDSVLQKARDQIMATEDEAVFKILDEIANK